jgi:hypothetical protein
MMIMMEWHRAGKTQMRVGTIEKMLSRLPDSSGAAYALSEGGRGWESDGCTFCHQLSSLYYDTTHV